MLVFKAFSRRLFTKLSFSSFDMPVASGMRMSCALSSSGLMATILTTVPLPCEEPSPIHMILFLTPSSRTAALTASALAWDRRRFASLLSCGLPFAWPSHRTTASGKALRICATERMTPRADGGMSCLFGSKSTPRSRAIASNRVSSALRCSSDQPEVSGISMSRSWSAANIRTFMPMPCEQPRPKHEMLFVTPWASTAARKDSARTWDKWCFASLSSGG
mmetsp:Transcript_3708/g.9659  ORF Transcript_3708/g.9659 Transcript_3708/m.9659 type:complete len:220 (-) Transcript_3708:1534-2193(-)